MELIPLIVIGTAVWVAIDASQLNVTSGKLGGGLLDMGVIGWTLGCLLLWIICFPAYLAKRSEYVALNKGGEIRRTKTTNKKKKSYKVFLGGSIVGILLSMIAGAVKGDLEVGFWFHIFVGAFLGAIAWLLIEVEA